MAKEKKALDLTNENIPPLKIILLLAWPLFLEQILGTLVSFADTAMVGALGVNATASVSISNPFMFLFNGVVVALGVGLTAYVARSVGAKDYEAAKAYIRHAFIILLMLGLPISIAMCLLYRQIPIWMGAEEVILDTAAQYVLITSVFRVFGMATMVLSSVFRGKGDTKTPLFINIGVNALNLIGNYVLINPSHTIRIGSLAIPMFGAGWGVAGAALSTGFSWFVGATLMGVMLFVKKDPTRLSLRDSFKPDRKLLGRVFKISFPAMLERICMSTAGIVVTKSIATLGTTVVAANSVYSTAESLSFMPAFAFATACTTLVGQSLGAKKPALAERYTHYTVCVGAIILGIAGLLMFLFARPMVSIITQDEAALDIAEKCLKIVAFIQPVQTAAWVFAGALRGAGDTKWPFYITALGNWFIRALGAVLCIRFLGMGLPEAVVCMCLDVAARLVMMYARFRLGKWKVAIKEH